MFTTLKFLLDFVKDYFGWLEYVGGKSFYFFKMVIKISRVGPKNRVGQIYGNAPIF